MSTLNLKPTHLLTVGAVLFAGFALYETFKKPGGALSSQPGQAQRDDGLTTWQNLFNGQQADAQAYAAAYTSLPLYNALSGPAA